MIIDLNLDFFWIVLGLVSASFRKAIGWTKLFVKPILIIEETAGLTYDARIIFFCLIFF